MKIFNVKWGSRSAGPGPLSDNTRTEIFMAGCAKAASGKPCKGCFNKELWSQDHFVAEETPEGILVQVRKFAPNNCVTFVGGEPFDQLDVLMDTCKLLKEAGYHITVITHYTLKDADLNRIRPLLENIDILIDGEYDETQRIWNDDLAGDNVHDVIGSANQIVWDVREWNDNNAMSIHGEKAGNLEALAIDINEDLHYLVKIMTASETVTIARKTIAA